MRPAVLALLIFESFSLPSQKRCWSQTAPDRCGKDPPGVAASFPDFFLTKHVSVT